MTCIKKKTTQRKHRGKTNHN